MTRPYTLTLALLLIASRAHADCASDAKAMQAALWPLVKEESSPLMVEAGDLLAAEGAPLEQAPIVKLENGKLTLNGIEERSPAALSADLTVLRENYALLHPAASSPPRLVTLVLGKAATWGTVVDVIAAAFRASYDRTQIVAWKMRTPPIVVPLGYDTFIAPIKNTTEPTRKAKLLSAAVGHATSGCAPLASVFERLASIAPDEKATYMVEHLSSALLACQCKVDLPALHASLFAVLAPSDLAHRFTQVTLRVRDAGPTLSFDKTATWGDVGGKLLDAVRKKNAYHLVAK